MYNQKALGLIFPSMHDETLPQMTGVRPIGSVPFGGRYRLIDFALSNMVAAGISKIGVITKTQYQSLMDHIGSGKAWDLSRKRECLYFLPPSSANDQKYAGRIPALSELTAFLNNSREDYVVLADCHVVGNLNYKELVENHIQSGADITVAYLRGALPPAGQHAVLTVGDGDRVTAVAINPPAGDDLAVGIGLYVIRKDLLIRLVSTAMSLNQTSFERDILQRQVGTLHIRGYEVKEYARIIASLADYFAVSMELLDPEVRAALFLKNRPVFTKVRDCAPALYGLDSSVSESLVADGVRVNGTVKQSILFRDVEIAKGAVVENCIIMQGTRIGRHCRLSNVIVDKDAVINDGRELAGCATYPMFIAKHAVV